jgi:hypothetical protein
VILTGKSPLFRAALGLLGGDPDPLSTLVRLRDAFPGATHNQIQTAVRETAVHFLVAGVVPAQAVDHA